MNGNTHVYFWIILQCCFAALDPERLDVGGEEGPYLIGAGGGLSARMWTVHVPYRKSEWQSFWQLDRRTFLSCAHPLCSLRRTKKLLAFFFVAYLLDTPSISSDCVPAPPPHHVRRSKKMPSDSLEESGGNLNQNTSHPSHSDFRSS